MRQLKDIHNDFERAVFLANYRSARQRLLRTLAVSLIAAKHGLRGLLYVWPLTLLLFIELPDGLLWVKLTLIVAALGAWLRFIYKAVHDDYLRFVRDRLIQSGAIARML